MNKTGPLRWIWLVILLCTILFFYGFYLGGVQLVIREVSVYFGKDIGGMGLLVSAQYITGILLPVVFGLIADRFGKKYVLCTFSAIFGIGCLLAGISTAVGCYMIGAVLIGAGYSVCESVSSSVLSEIDPEKSIQLINLSQGVLSFGAVISPLLLQFLCNRFNLSWRIPFLICAAAYIITAILLICTAFPDSDKSLVIKDTPHPNYFSCRPFVYLFISIIIYLGLENGISYFTESLFSLRLQAEKSGALALSAYWIGMTVSRFMLGSLIGRPKRLLTICFFSSAFFLALLGLMRSPLLGIAVCALVGFSYGPIWSALVGSAAELFPDNSAGATGIMSAGCGIGGAAAPVLMGAVSEYSLSAAFLMLASMALAGLIISRFGLRR